MLIIHQAVIVNFHQLIYGNPVAGKENIKNPTSTKDPKNNRRYWCGASCSTPETLKYLQGTRAKNEGDDK